MILETLGQITQLPIQNYNMSQQSETKTHPGYQLYEDHISPQNHTYQQHSNHKSLDLNHSVIKLFRQQTELKHSTQCLHQQITDAWNNISQSSSNQENLHVINDIPIFKPKDLQSINEWLEQIGKVTSLTNKDPYKLTLLKTQGSFSRIISSYLFTLGWKK